MHIKTEDKKPLKLGKEYWVFDNTEGPNNIKLPRRMMLMTLAITQQIEASDKNGSHHITSNGLPCASGNCFPSPHIAKSSGPKAVSRRMSQIEEEALNAASKIVVPPRDSSSNLVNPKILEKQANLQFATNEDVYTANVIGNGGAPGIFESYDLAMQAYLVKLMARSNQIAETVETVRENLAKGA